MFRHRLLARKASLALPESRDHPLRGSPVLDRPQSIIHPPLSHDELLSAGPQWIYAAPAYEHWTSEEYNLNRRSPHSAPFQFSSSSLSAALSDPPRPHVALPTHEHEAPSISPASSPSREATPDDPSVQMEQDNEHPSFPAGAPLPLQLLRDDPFDARGDQENFLMSPIYVFPNIFDGWENPLPDLSLPSPGPAFSGVEDGSACQSISDNFTFLFNQSDDNLSTLPDPPDSNNSPPHLPPNLDNISTSNQYDNPDDVTSGLSTPFHGSHSVSTVSSPNLASPLELPVNQIPTNSSLLFSPQTCAQPPNSDIVIVPKKSHKAKKPARPVGPSRLSSRLTLTPE